MDLSVFVLNQRLTQIQLKAVLVEVPSVQYADKVIDVPVTRTRSVPMVQKVQKKIDVPQVGSLRWRFWHSNLKIIACRRTLTGYADMAAGR